MITDTTPLIFFVHVFPRERKALWFYRCGEVLEQKQANKNHNNTCNKIKIYYYPNHDHEFRSKIVWKKADLNEKLLVLLHICFVPSLGGVMNFLKTQAAAPYSGPVTTWFHIKHMIQDTTVVTIWRELTKNTMFF